MTHRDYLTGTTFESVDRGVMAMKIYSMFLRVWEMNPHYSWASYQRYSFVLSLCRVAVSIVPGYWVGFHMILPKNLPLKCTEHCGNFKINFNFILKEFFFFFFKLAKHFLFYNLLNFFCVCVCGGGDIPCSITKRRSPFFLFIFFIFY